MPKPTNALANPLAYVREVSEANQRVGKRLQQQRSDEVWQEAQRKAAEARKREALLKSAKPNPRPYSNPLPRTPESIEAERMADQLMALKKRPRNALSGM